MVDTSNNLEAIIQGTSKAETECVLEFLNGRPDCARYRYGGYFSSQTKNEEVIKAFDWLLKAKVKLDKQEDASAELKESLKTIYYPYGTGLQMQNERNKGNEEIDFNIKLKNAGKETLLVHDVTVSCSCLKLRSKNSYAIEAGGEDCIDLTFTANAPGEIEREIMLTTNGMEPLKTIRILAHARQ